MKSILAVAVLASLSIAVEAETCHTTHTHATAPIGVMGDHNHHRGEWMASYRFMTMDMDGHRAGTERLSSGEVFDRGFMMAATEMQMDMHMLGLMYAPNDHITLMLMGMWIEQDMTMKRNPMAGGGTGRHKTSGWGDTAVSALVQLWEKDEHRIQVGLGLSVPTGATDELHGSVVQPYGMQLGSGTWDILPSFTYVGTGEHWAWGGQVRGELRSEGKNGDGYQLGNRGTVTTWLSRSISHSFDASTRLIYDYRGETTGQHHGPLPAMSPNHFSENYGGETLEGAIGCSYTFSGKTLHGHRLSIEYLVPIYQDLNGVGMNRTDSLVVGWQKQF